MAIGKNKKGGKGGKKKQKYDAFHKKEWYRIKAPRYFDNREMGWTCVNKSAGNKIAKDSLMGRVYEFSLGDLKRSANTAEEYHKQAEKDKDQGYGSRKMKLVTEEVRGNDESLTNFAGMTLTTDKLRDSIQKWHSLIEAHEDVRTTDGYLLRVFAMARTRDSPQDQVKNTCYAKSSQVRDIRRKMVETIRIQIDTCTLEDVVMKLIPNTIGKEIRKTCQFTFPIGGPGQNNEEGVYIRKVKVLKRPPLDYTKIMAIHEGAAAEDVPEQLGMDAPEEDIQP